MAHFPNVAELFLFIISTALPPTCMMATPLRDAKGKDALKPNPHPYAIKTTSTALLTRSNSSSQSAKPIHSYIPSPSPSPTRSRVLNKHFGYAHVHGHRYSRSLTSESPRPLPVPPSPSPTKQLGHGHSPSFDVDLPANPKLWTPSQLATYLATALRVRSGESLQLPTPVARDIATFVRNSKISGKEFLRFNEQDLNSYGINKLWASALMAASRALRQNVLKGRIWGFGNTDFEGPNEDPSNTNPFIEHVQYDSASSTSSVDIDRPYSDNEFFDVTFQSNARNVGGSMDDDPTPVKRARKGRVSLGKLRNGRVKGMVESFEKSGSVDETIGSWPVRTRSGSVSSMESEDRAPHSTIRPQQTGTAVYHTQPPILSPPQFLPPSYQTSEPAQSDAGFATDVYDTATEGGDEAEHPPTLNFEGAIENGNTEADEELSMEELLAQLDAEKASGAHAWEREVNTHGAAIITMKHVPSSNSPLERVPTGSSTSTNGSIKGRPLPAPPASGSPVVFLPAAQTLSSHSTSNSNTTGSQRPLPVPGSAGALSPHILAPTPRHGSLRGLGASWNAIDADGVVAQLTGSVESLVSANDDGISAGVGDTRDAGGSLGSSEGWVKPSHTGWESLHAESVGAIGKEKMSKRRIRLSGTGEVGARTNPSRKSSGQTRRPAITEIFGATGEEEDTVHSPNHHDTALQLQSQLTSTAEQLEEANLLLAAEKARIEGYEAEKITWSSRDEELRRELDDARKLIEVYRMKLEESEKKVGELEETRRRDLEAATAAAAPVIGERTGDQSRSGPRKANAPTFGAGVGFGLLLNLIPQTVLGRLFGQQIISFEGGPARSRSASRSGDGSSRDGKDDIELGESQNAASSSSSSLPPPPPSSSTSTTIKSSPSSKTWKDYIPSPLYEQWIDPSSGSPDSRQRADSWEAPTTIRALPPYVLLVGLGVAAVVLRVVLRRVGYRLGVGVGMRR